MGEIWEPAGPLFHARFPRDPEGERERVREVGEIWEPAGPLFHARFPRDPARRERGLEKWGIGLEMRFRS